MLVLSHSDADHLGAVDEICDKYSVKKILCTGFKRTSDTWVTADTAVNNEKAMDLNFSYFEFPPVATFRFGDTLVTIVAGFRKPPDNWNELSPAEKRNSISIVIRLQYKGKSILFTGDTVGRHIGDPVNTYIAAEKYIVDNSDFIPIDSDVLIAPHHGADNASSTKFITTVSPDFVIFSSGHKYHHPSNSVAEQYISNGVPLNNIFRTDLEDDEGGTEWTHGRVSSHKDIIGDDDVDILIRPNREITVEYRNSHQNP